MRVSAVTSVTSVLALLVTCIAPRATLAQTSESWRALELPGGEALREASDSHTEQAAIGAVYGTMSRDLRASETEGLAEALRDEFGRLHARHPNGVPSVLLRSHLERQSPGRFDALVFTPSTQTARVVVFLHGFGGNAVLPCALVAEAAARVDAMTVCPSLGGAGHWGSARGARVVEATIGWLRRTLSEAPRVVLAGLSNGGIGASRLARRFDRQLRGMILLSGAAPGTRSRVPALVIHGRSDTMTSPRLARSFARRSPRATLSMLDSNHFALLHRRDEVQSTIERWLRDVFAASTEDTVERPEYRSRVHP